MTLDHPLGHWASTAPDRTAISGPTGTLSYAALKARVAALAARLRECGLGQGDRIGILMHRSADAVVAVLATLRSGAAYVPLDPTAPSERLQVISSSCALSAIIVDEALGAAAVDLNLPLTLLPDGSVLSNLQGQSGAQSGHKAPLDLAYILYTSGSTGVPKGMMHTHQSGRAYVEMAGDLCQLSPTDRVAHQTPLHFDLSLFEIFSTLRAGACIVIVPLAYARMPASLAKLVEESGVTVWYSVPFAISQLVHRGALDQRDFSALRIVMFGGERMPPADLHAFAAHTPNATFINAYGPAEINACTVKRLGRTEIDGTSPISIGPAARGIAAHVDAEGELWIGGDQLMAGYWGAPDLTAAAIQTMNINGHPCRMYRSGDLVERAENGDFNLIGRRDRQVKVRGHRVELDEIDLILGRTAGVVEAVSTYSRETHRILSYLTVDDDTDSVVRAARDRCAATLPIYAVPDEFICVPKMPRTSTGKLDLMKLAAARNE